MNGEQGGGSVSAPMAVCVLAMAVAAGLAIDGVRATQGLARADAIAEEAARAAGQVLDPHELAAGRTAVDEDAAVTAARAHLTAAGADGVAYLVAPDRIRVEATISRPTVLLGLIGRDELTSSGSAEAVLVPVLPTEVPP